MWDVYGLRPNDGVALLGVQCLRSYLARSFAAPRNFVWRLIQTETLHSFRSAPTSLGRELYIPLLRSEVAKGANPLARSFTSIAH